VRCSSVRRRGSGFTPPPPLGGLGVPRRCGGGTLEAAGLAMTNARSRASTAPPTRGSRTASSRSTPLTSMTLLAAFRVRPPPEAQVHFPSEERCVPYHAHGERDRSTVAAVFIAHGPSPGSTPLRIVDCTTPRTPPPAQPPSSAAPSVESLGIDCDRHVALHSVAPALPLLLPALDEALRDRGAWSSAAAGAPEREHPPPTCRLPLENLVDSRV